MKPISTSLIKGSLGTSRVKTVDVPKPKASDGPSDILELTPDGNVQLNPQDFASKYQSRVQSKLKSADVAWKPKVPFLVKLGLKKLSQSQANLALAQAAVAAFPTLGAAATLSIASDIGAESMPASPEKLAKLEDAKIPLAPELVVEEGEAKIHYVRGLQGKYAGGRGGALARTAYVDIGTKDDTSPGTALGDFIAGHELSHIENRDSLKGGGVQHLLKTLERSSTQVTGNLGLQIGVLFRELSTESNRQSREDEFRCDEDGFNFALSKGHSPESVAKAAELEFPNFEKHEDDSELSHPSDYSRIQALRRQAQSHAVN